MTGSKPSGFIWYDLMTRDLDKAAAFYRDVVGWEIRDSGMPGMRYMLFGRDGKDVGGMVALPQAGQYAQQPRWAGHLVTPDVDGETAAVAADGGRVCRPPQDIPGVGRYSVVADPQGAEFLLFQPLPTQAPRLHLLPGEPGGVGWRELTTTDWEQAWSFYSKHFGWTKDVSIDMGPMGYLPGLPARGGYGWRRHDEPAQGRGAGFAGTVLALLLHCCGYRGCCAPREGWRRRCDSWSSPGSWRRLDSAGPGSTRLPLCADRGAVIGHGWLFRRGCRALCLPDGGDSIHRGC